MNIEDVSKFYRIFDKEGIVLSYHGPFLQNIIEEISSIISLKLCDISNMHVNSRYLTLFIEQAQNVLRYSSDSIMNGQGSLISNGLILTGIENDHIYIITCNPVDKGNEAVLKEKLGHLGKCSKEEMDQLFKDQLKENSKSEINKGAGLGLIEISRKSDKLEYHFTKMKSGKIFFSMKTVYKPE